MQFLVIEGNIGVGKTSLAEMLAEEYGAKLVKEQFADNPFLPKFYANQERYSFPLELSFLAERYKQIKKELFPPDLFSSLVISDYHFTKSAIFAENTLTKDEFRLFRQIFDIISESLPKPDLYVYLHAGREKLLKNIAKRGRSYEKNISGEYLGKIKEGYFRFLHQKHDFPVLIINSDNIDFVNKTKHYLLLKEAIFNSEYKLGVNHLII